MSEKLDSRLSKEETMKIINQTTIMDVGGNIFLAVFKLFAGIVGKSTAMISDAMHTISDVGADIIAFVGKRLSISDPDKEHPYGHDRLECIASIFLAALLFSVGLTVGLGCVDKVITGEYKTQEAPEMIAVVAAVVSIVVKEAMFWYTMAQAKKMHSSVFKADAWHHRSDALSSIGALIGIIGARMGYPIMDVIAGFIICLVIIVVGINVFRDAVSKMLDTSADDDFVKEVTEYVEKAAAEEQTGTGLSKLFTRKFGEKVYVDIYMKIDGALSVKEAYGISQRIKTKAEEEFEDIKHVNVQIISAE